MSAAEESVPFPVEAEPSIAPTDGTATPHANPILESDKKIATFSELAQVLDLIYQQKYQYWEETKAAITKLLQRADFSNEEMNKFTFWDCEKPYTRNLVATDNKNYTMLLLCWNPGRESKIHDHPCDGCFVKALRGSVRESRYMLVDDTNEIRLVKVKFFNEGQIAFMNNDLGLHKIGNPNRDTGSVALHLYTPPFKSCKVWSEDGVGKLDKFEVAHMGHFSMFGHRTPHLEGRPGTHARVLAELNGRFEGVVVNDDARTVLKQFCSAPRCETHSNSYSHSSSDDLKNIRTVSPDGDTTDSEQSFTASSL